jgi:hypothetical protein
MNYSSALSLFVFLLISSILYSQKSIKPFEVGELKKGDLSDKSFKDYPEYKSRILFDYGDADFVLEEGQFAIYRTRHLRIKFLNDTVLTVHQLGLTSFDADEIIEFSQYSIVDGDVKKKDIKDQWAELNKYEPLLNQLNEFRSGDILEFRFRQKIESAADIPGWQFEYEIPVDYSEFYAEVPGMFKYRPIFKGYIPLLLNSSELLKDKNKNWIEIDGFYVYQNRFICVDIPPFEKVIFSPSSKNYLTSVDFYLEKIEAYNAYKKVEGQTWEKVAKELYNEENIQGRINNFDASLIIQRLALDSNKANSVHVIYNWVKDTFTWNGDIGISAEHPLDEVLDSKTGSIAEINLLLVALLEEAQIFARPTVLKTVDQGSVNLEFPSASQFNYLIAWVDVNGEKAVLDATDKCLEIGVLRPVCLNNKGLKITSRFEEWADLENDLFAKSNIISSVSAVDGSLVAKMNVTKSNYFAFEECKSAGEVKEMIRIEPGVVMSDVEVFKNEGSGYRIDLTCNADSIVKKSGTTWSFHPFWIDRLIESPFKEKERKYPIVFPYLFEYNWNFVLNLDEKTSVSDFPDSEEIMTLDKTMRFIYQVTALDGILQINAQFVIYKRQFEPSSYEDIQDFYKKVLNKFDQELKIKVKN